MFTTRHDAANRAVVKQYAPDAMNVVGLALREDKKVVDKITKGARMHPYGLRAFPMESQPFCHSRVRGNPRLSAKPCWMPAFAGMTTAAAIARRSKSFSARRS